MQGHSSTEQPFAGLRIVDWSTVAAAPSTGQLFAVLGAEVIKIEPPVSKVVSDTLYIVSYSTH